MGERHIERERETRTRCLVVMNVTMRFCCPYHDHTESQPILDGLLKTGNMDRDVVCCVWQGFNNLLLGHHPHCAPP